MSTPHEQFEVLTQDVAEVTPAGDLLTRLETGRPLRIKLGLDPTAEHVTLGWAVPLRKLRRFQDLGHLAVVIVGDYTARIGDPSGVDKTRPMLSKQEVDAHVDRVLEQFRLILSEERLEVRRNSEWLEGLGTDGILELTNNVTVAQVLGRDDFGRRYEGGQPLTVREFLYPILQAYDSVAIRADVELGGTDQHFTFMLARHVMRAYGQEPQVVMTMPLIEGTDGAQKMSQSLGNFVGITEPADEIFGKLMRLPDELMPKYFRLCTDVTETELAELQTAERPERLKRRLAFEVVALYHGHEAAQAALGRFDQVFVSHEVPEDIPWGEIPDDCVRDGVVYLPGLMKALGLAPSGSEARRLIAQGGVRVDGRTVDVEEIERGALAGTTIQVGKRRFVRLRP